MIFPLKDWANNPWKGGASNRCKINSFHFSICKLSRLLCDSPLGEGSYNKTLPWIGLLYKLDRPVVRLRRYALLVIHSRKNPLFPLADPRYPYCWIYRWISFLVDWDRKASIIFWSFILIICNCLYGHIWCPLQKSQKNQVHVMSHDRFVFVLVAKVGQRVKYCK